jgi:hypothetical protein
VLKLLKNNQQKSTVNNKGSNAAETVKQKTETAHSTPVTA